ncbi:DUF5367 family protein [Viridibacillus sp. YIM B01967]|uniref:DUF5367 family protein n=1 Tax=Viridibacillus soli TaxID=2798301 RepID=A0ABS1H427_9BACL|nr:DUF5367 family protein [Viridibacillus soli]MBK3494146.1 DUF5367 family protein [Viridibacillus soli]
MKEYFKTALWGILIWVFVTVFFIYFGEHVLFSPGTNSFVISLFLLLVGTGFLLVGVTCLYLLFDKSDNSPLKFGLVGTTIGLILDTFSLSNHHFIFPELDDSQVIAFAAWMSFAYALYLLIPTLIYKLRKRKNHRIQANLS